MQGGGALGAFQLGVYQALHEAGMEPDWVIGTSIGAINASIIAGNSPQRRMEHLEEFWSRVTTQGWHASLAEAVRPWSPDLGRSIQNTGVMLAGLPSFFAPQWPVWQNPRLHESVEQAAYYSTEPLRQTLGELVDLDLLNEGSTRLTVGAVNLRSGQMRYFDTENETLRIDHVMASGALPPAFGAVRIDGDVYWDGGLYSNTPIEVVLDDPNRRSSLIFATHMWQAQGIEPDNVWDIQARLKDIQFASRADSHIQRQRQLHCTREGLRQLIAAWPPKTPFPPHLQHLCETPPDPVMHTVKIKARRLSDEDHTKDIDFSARTIAERRSNGYEATREAIRNKPWLRGDPSHGALHVHEFPSVA